MFNLFWALCVAAFESIHVLKFISGIVSTNLCNVKANFGWHGRYLLLCGFSIALMATISTRFCVTQYPTDEKSIVVSKYIYTITIKRKYWRLNVRLFSHQLKIIHYLVVASRYDLN